jgi:hypothetical protein
VRSRAAFLIAALAGSAALIAQTAPFVRSDAPAWDPSWEEGRTIDSEILADELSLRIRNVKPEYLAFINERRRVVRFASREDIKRYGPVVLPERLDPPYDRLGVPYEQREARPYPLRFNLRVDHFAARHSPAAASTARCIPTTSTCLHASLACVRRELVSLS